MNDIIRCLKEYDGPSLKLMEVCGTHTASIAKNGIKSMLSPKIRLVSGPGCPVCVTVSAYIDRLIELTADPSVTVVTFGDMLRVPGSRQSLREAAACAGRSAGEALKMVYSPLDVLKMARERPDRRFVFAAVGFETTAPVYAMLLRRAIEQGIGNLQLLTALKVMPPVIDWVCALPGEPGGGQTGGIDGFLAPGHVCVITGSSVFEQLAQRHGLPFVVAGFEGEQLLSAIYALVKLKGQGRVLNLYPSAVLPEGNPKAAEAVSCYFEPAPAAWRGMGIIENSGLVLRREYAQFDAGSLALNGDSGSNPACCCERILTGRMEPGECPLFGTVCTPQTPQGACMVSMEGSCFNSYAGKAAP